MSRPVTPGTESVDTADLTIALEASLTSYFGRTCRIGVLRRQPYIYSTSYLLEELEVELVDGTRLNLVFKNLSQSGLMDSARDSKPAFLYDPLREIETYRRLLNPDVMGTAACYGAVAGPDRHWLFLEKVIGRELYQVGDVAVWSEVARWSAAMHERFAHRGDELQQANAHLLRYDGAFYRRWMERAEIAAHGLGQAGGRATDLRRISRALEEVLERLARVPTTLVHGELYPSNVVVVAVANETRVCALDWEMAGLGPGLLDVAALCTGWAEQHRRTIALTYRDALTQPHDWPQDEEDLVNLLDYCALCLDVQWLGWSPSWCPPPEHARNWLGDALQRIERLGL